MSAYESKADIVVARAEGRKWTRNGHDTDRILRCGRCSALDHGLAARRHANDLAGETGDQAVAFGGEILVRHATFGVARKFRLQAIEEEHFVCAFVLGPDGTARL